MPNRLRGEGGRQEGVHQQGRSERARLPRLQQCRRATRGRRARRPAVGRSACAPTHALQLRLHWPRQSMPRLPVQPPPAAAARHFLRAAAVPMPHCRGRRRRGRRGMPLWRSRGRKQTERASTARHLQRQQGTPLPEPYSAQPQTQEHKGWHRQQNTPAPAGTVPLPGPCATLQATHPLAILRIRHRHVAAGAARVVWAAQRQPRRRVGGQVGHARERVLLRAGGGEEGKGDEEAGMGGGHERAPAAGEGPRYKFIWLARTGSRKHASGTSAARPRHASPAAAAHRRRARVLHAVASSRLDGGGEGGAGQGAGRVGAVGRHAGDAVKVCGSGKRGQTAGHVSKGGRLGSGPEARAVRTNGGKKKKTKQAPRSL